MALFYISAINGQSVFELKDNLNKKNTIFVTQYFIRDSLKLNVGKDFYILKLDTSNANTKMEVESKMHFYVYASSKILQKSIFGDDAYHYFGHNDSLATVFADSLKNTGYDVMVYKTAGTSDAKFNHRLLEYNPGTISFIMLHESIHRHKQNTKSNLPYIFEEALGDLTAFLFSGKGLNTKQDKKKHAKFLKINEKIYALVNKAISGEISKEKCTHKMKRILKHGDDFQKDRFNYEINNAFLIRYTSYCKYYFLLKKIYTQFGSPDLFYIAMFKLTGAEEEAIKILNDYLVLPTNKF